MESLGNLFESLQNWHQDIEETSEGLHFEISI